MSSPGPPDPVSNCSVSEESQSSFSVSCQPGFDGGLAQVFLLSVVEREGGTSVANLTSRTPSFQVSGLLSERTFSLTLQAENSRGASEVTALLAVTTKPATISQTQLDQAKIGSLKTRLIISPVLGVLIGVGCAIILVSITLLAIMCFRVRYEKFSRNLFGRSRGREEKDIQDDLYVDLTDNSPDLIPSNGGKFSPAIGLVWKFQVKFLKSPPSIYKKYLGRFY